MKAETKSEPEVDIDIEIRFERELRVRIETEIRIELKLKFRTKLAYGIGGTADNTMYTLASTFLLFFLTSVIGIRPLTAGLIVALGSIWEVICGPVVAYLSDNTVSRYGKRKPYLILSSLPVMLFTGLLFTPISASYDIKIVYYLVATLLFWQTFSSFFVPYMAWGSDLTDDYNERTSLRSYAYVFNQLGMALGMVMPSFCVGLLEKAGVTTARAWSYTAFAIGLLAAASLLVAACNIKDGKDDKALKCEGLEESSELKDIKKRKNQEAGALCVPKIRLGIFREIVGEYAIILKLKPVRQIVGASLLYLIADTFFMSDRIYYFTYNLGLSSNQITLILVMIIVLGVSLTPFVSRICEKFDKKNVFVGGMAAGGILLIIGRILGSENLAWAYGISAAYVLANTSYWQLMPSLLYDLCEVEELESGKRHAGQLISLQALSESLSTAIGSQLLGIILDCAGFRSDAAAQTEVASNWISNNFSLIPGLCMLIVAFIIFKYPVNRGYFEGVKKELEKRRSVI